MDKNRNTVKLDDSQHIAFLPNVREHFHNKPYDDLCYRNFKEMYIDPLSGQLFKSDVPTGQELKFHISTAGFIHDTMLDKMIEELSHNAAAKMFMNYIYGIDLAEVCRDYIRQTWEMITSPLWSETLYRVRPIDIQKGGWKCRRRTRLGSILARGAETKQSIL